jgi:oligopeptide transport system permease protein
MPKFLLGTTENGHDVLKVAFYSLRTSLLLAIVVFAINFTIGLVWGSFSGYFGGNIDLLLERVRDILGGVPFIVVVTLCILHLGNNIVTFGIALCLTGWLGTAGRTRTQFYRFKGREYVLASRTLGAKDSRLIFKHILPNALGTIVTGAVLMIPGVITSEATLAYLQLGLQGTASFGVLLSDNQKFLSTLPVLIIFPSIIISLLMISFNLFGNGLRDALNPSLKGSE